MNKAKSMEELGKDFEVRKGKDGTWGIFLTEYNVRIATFSENTEQSREKISKLIEQSPDSVVDVDKLTEHFYRYIHSEPNKLIDIVVDEYYLHKMIRQAVVDTKQLLQSQPAVDEDVAYWMDLAHELGEKLNEANKPRVVTRGKTDKWMDEFRPDASYHPNVQQANNEAYKKLFYEMLKEFGVEVKE